LKNAPDLAETPKCKNTERPVDPDDAAGKPINLGPEGPGQTSGLTGRLAVV